MIVNFIAEMQILKRKNSQLQAENKRLKEENRWIPVSERLPEVGEHVFMSSGKEVFVGPWFTPRPYITCWKPIISPYQALKG